MSNSCDRTSVAGRRDYAMLVLLARLGLRCVEVAGLGLDDIDWRAGNWWCVANATARTGCRYAALAQRLRSNTTIVCRHGGASLRFMISVRSTEPLARPGSFDRREVWWRTSIVTWPSPGRVCCGRRG